MDQSPSIIPFVKRQGLERTETVTSTPPFYLLVAPTNPPEFLRRPEQLRGTEPVGKVLCFHPTGCPAGRPVSLGWEA